MAIRFSRAFCVVSLAVASLAASPAQALTNLVFNGSFEIVPAGGLVVFATCCIGCSYSASAIPGWTGGNSLQGAGQFRPGSSSGNFIAFNYVPDGITVAYTNAVSLTQIVSATVVAGATYNFSVDIARNFGAPNLIGSAVFNIAGRAFNATGVAPTLGNWSTYSASYVATNADAGRPITISLNTTGIQGDFDNVILTATVPDPGAVPEPGTWAMLLAGFGLVGAAMRRRGMNRVTEPARASVPGTQY